MHHTTHQVKLLDWALNQRSPEQGANPAGSRRRTQARRFGWLLALLSILPITFAGCGGAAEARLKNDLKSVGLMYHNYLDRHRQGPPGWEELAAGGTFPEENAAILARIRNAGYEVKWNVTFADATEGSSNFVLAQRSGGGMRLMLDGSVKDSP